MRVQQSQTGEPRLRNHDDRIRILTPRDPTFRVRPVPGDARRFTIEADSTLQSGADVLSVPFRPYVGDDPLPQVHTSALTYTLDLDESVLADGTTVGGRIDGVALAANTDYLLWGFLTAAVGGEIEGLGITTRPRATGITMPASSPLGGTGIVVTVGTNLGNRFAVDARVLFRDGTTSGSSWNQGIITATAANTITVNLDASWGLATNSNTTLNSVGSVECLQLDNMQPRVGGETTSYNSDQPYCYLGSIQTDDSSNIRSIRKRGDFLLLSTGIVTPVIRSGVTASESFQAALGNWIPLGANHVRMYIAAVITAGTPGSARVIAAPDGITANTTTLIQNAAVSGSASFESGELNIRTRDCSFYYQYIETGTITANHNANLMGHFEENW